MSFARLLDFSVRRGAVAIALCLPMLALADRTGTVTLKANTAFSLDSGTTSSTGDILWTGSSITFQGKAIGAALGPLGPSGFAMIDASFFEPTPAESSFAQNLASAQPIPAMMLDTGWVFGVITNGLNGAAVLVTANGSGSITLQYATFGSTGSGGTGPGYAPLILAVMNNSSQIPDGFPNSGIAPSTLFIIQGTGLADPGTPVLQDTTKGLPLTLDGASISVTVNGVTTNPPIYYTSPTQIAAVLPAKTPVGSGTITVTHNGVPSTPATINVVANALGFNSYNGSGIAQDAVTYALLDYTHSGKPGQTIVLWGTGLGADPADSDTSYTSTPHALNVPLKLYIGGVAANVLYQGASVYPGVNEIVATIPSGVPSGCYVPVAGVIGNVVSNIVTLPIAASGGVCSDDQFGIDGTKISSAASSSGPVNTGSLMVIQSTAPDSTGTMQTTNVALAGFSRDTGFSYSEGGTVSVGGCVLNESGIDLGSATSTGLDAGTIALTGPSGTQTPLAGMPNAPGSYYAQLGAGAIPASGGTFTFKGSGGSQVGSFTAQVAFPGAMLTWTNQNAVGTVNRAQGLNVTWSGGAPGTYVIIGGTSSSGAGANGSYTCIAPASAGQFTVPSYVLLGMPVGSGTTSLENTTAFTPFSASGLTYGSAFGAVAVTVNSTYND